MPGLMCDILKTCRYVVHMALLLYQIDNLQLGTKKASSKSFLSDLEPGDGWI